MDFVHAARIELVSRGVLVGLVGTDSVWTDGWIFQHQRYIDVRSTGSACVVLASRAGWSGPNRHNTVRFPRLQVEAYVDPTRDTNLNPSGEAPPTVQERADAIFKAIDPVLHRVDGGGFIWGGVGGIRIVSSLRGVEPDIVEVPDGDGEVRMLVSYDLELG
jgi:hypothetical protein